MEHNISEREKISHRQKESNSSKLSNPAPSPVSSNKVDETREEAARGKFKWSKTAEYEGARRLLLWSFIASIQDQEKQKIAMSILHANAPKGAENAIENDDTVNQLSLMTPEEREDVIFKAAIDDDLRTLLIPFFESTKESPQLGDMNTAIRLMCKAEPEICLYILESINAVTKDTPQEKLDAYRKRLVGTSFEIFCGFALQYRNYTSRDYIKEDFLEQFLRYQGGDVAMDKISVNCHVEGCFISGAPKNSPFHMGKDHHKRLRDALHEHAIEVRAKPKTAKKLAEKLILHMKHDTAFDLLVWLRDIDNPSKHRFCLVQCKARGDPEVDRIDVRKYVGEATSIQNFARRLDCLTPLFVSSTISSHHPFLKIFNGSLRFDVKCGRLIPWLLPDICDDDIKQGLFNRVFLDALNMNLLAEKKENVVLPKPEARAPLQSLVSRLPPVRQQEVSKSFKRLVAETPLIPRKRNVDISSKATKPVTKLKPIPVASKRQLPPSVAPIPVQPRILEDETAVIANEDNITFKRKHEEVPVDPFLSWLARKRNRSGDTSGGAKN